MLWLDMYQYTQCLIASSDLYLLWMNESTGVYEVSLFKLPRHIENTSSVSKPPSSSNYTGSNALCASMTVFLWKDEEVSLCQNVFIFVQVLSIATVKDGRAMKVSLFSSDLSRLIASVKSMPLDDKTAVSVDLTPSLNTLAPASWIGWKFHNFRPLH